MTHNRKRGRSLRDDDSLDFMPLSKRINNLHINNGIYVVPEKVEDSTTKSPEWGPGPPVYYDGVVHMPQESPQPQPGDWQTPVPQYCPDLNESQNPYYYNNNKLLFDLHLQRLQRYGHNYI